MDLELYYSFLAAFCILQIAIVMNRTLATEYKETVDLGFCKMLACFMLFNAADILWGISATRVLNVPIFWYMGATYLFHVMAGIAAFVWFGYILTYMRLSDIQHKILNVARYALIVAQMTVLFTNVINHKAFYVDADKNFCTGPLRPILYALHFSYFITLIGFSIWKLVKDSESDKYLCKCAMLFSLIPLVFGLLQMLFYDAPLYSLGFAVCAIAIYTFNVTHQREHYLKKQAAKYSSEANVDVLTGLFNRRVYEDEIAGLTVDPPEGNFMYLSMDLNGLKNVNDDKGHDAGDELLKGAAQCMKDCFGQFGHVYRIGGDEFCGILSIEKDKLTSLEIEFERLLRDWKGTMVESPSVSCGYVGIDEYPDKSIYDLVKIADQRMYVAKAAYYQSRGIDRRQHDSVYEAIYDSYNTIFEVELGAGNFRVLKSEIPELKTQIGLHGDMSELLNAMVGDGRMRQEDCNRYLEVARVQEIAQYFETTKNREFNCYYNRLLNGELKREMVTVIPSKEYDHTNKIVYVYVKMLENELAIL